MDIHGILFMLVVPALIGIAIGTYIRKRKPAWQRPLICFVLGWVSAGLFQYLVAFIIESGIV